MRSRAHLVVTLIAPFGACMLLGCTAAAIEDKLPSAIGLPADAPARPATSYEYPAVHDMPPPRSNAPLTEDEQIRLEKELSTLRSKQERLNVQGGKPRSDFKQKKKPSGSPAGQSDGAKPNP